MLIFDYFVHAVSCTCFAGAYEGDLQLFRNCFLVIASVVTDIELAALSMF